MGRFTLILGLAGSALLLSACSESQKQTLGFSQPPPDEFRVITRAPLTVPPNLALRPPIPGAVRPQEGTPSEQARQAVFRAGETGKQAVTPLTPADGLSTGERVLLRDADATNAPTDIRQVVDAETRQINQDNTTLIDTLIFWKDSPPTGVAINASAEARRIQEREALGEPVTGQGVPVLERKERTLFGSIL